MKEKMVNRVDLKVIKQAKKLWMEFRQAKGLEPKYLLLIFLWGLAQTIPAQVVSTQTISAQAVADTTDVVGQASAAGQASVAGRTGTVGQTGANGQAGATVGAAAASEAEKRATAYEQLVDRAYAAARVDSLAHAEQLMKEALKLQPSHPYNAVLFSRLGAVQQQQDKTEEALQSYTYSLNLAPESVTTLLQRAALYLESGQPDKAYIDYCEALDHEKDNVEALTFRSFILLRRQEYKSARTDFNHLLKLNPDDYQALFGLALSYQKEQKYDESLTRYNRLIESAPNDAKAYIARAELYLEMKKPKQAKADLQTALAHGATQAEVKELMKQCK
jgi:tetratricopeptide (TPR) repeat protein